MTYPYRGAASVNIGGKKQELHLRSGSAQHGMYTPFGYTCYAQRHCFFFTRTTVWTGLLWKIPPDGAFQLHILHKQLWVSLNSVSVGKDFNKKENRPGAIPHTLPPPNLLIFLLPAPQLDFTRTIWKGLKA